jgi:phage shock protein B
MLTPGIGELAVILIITAMPFLLVYSIIVLTRSGSSKRSREVADEETRTIQELNQGFQRMEDRIEALETILMDHPRARSPRAHTKFD